MTPWSNKREKTLKNSANLSNKLLHAHRQSHEELNTMMILELHTYVMLISNEIGSCTLVSKLNLHRIKNVEKILE